MKDITLKEIFESYLFLLPLILFLSIFIIFPVLGSVAGSFYRDVAFLAKKLIWFKNYATIVKDPSFRQSLRFTLSFICASVPLEIVFGLFFAVLLNLRIPFRGFLRAAILIPWAIPAAISARAWELIYNYSYGLANFVVTKLGVSAEPVNWLGTSAGAFWAVVIADVWKTTPFVAIILLAGLQAIPEEIYDQAKVDRAGFVRTFRSVTAPLLLPVLTVALLFRTIDALRIFDLIYVLTQGGPGGETTSVSLFAYRYFLSGDFGYGSAVSVLLFLIALVLSLLYVKAGRFGETVK